jgi:hypothetical protein
MCGRVLFLCPEIVSGVTSTFSVFAIDERFDISLLCALRVYGE